MANNQFSVRLEELRETLGIGTTQEFVAKLNAGSKGEEIPYATARRYHRDREPPVTYLAEVARVFDVSRDWLFFGRGQMHETAHVDAVAIQASSEPYGLNSRGFEHWKVARGLELKWTILKELGFEAPEAFDEHVPYWVAPLAEVWTSVGVPIQATSPLGDDPDSLAADMDEFGALRLTWISGEFRVDQFKTLGEIMRRPLEALGFCAEEMSREVLGQYLLSMGSALLTLGAERTRQRRGLASDLGEESEET